MKSNIKLTIAIVLTFLFMITVFIINLEFGASKVFAQVTSPFPSDEFGNMGDYVEAKQYNPYYFKLRETGPLVTRCLNVNRAVPCTPTR